ncbi:unnamed protein product [Blepharisma stoltei]|uniref:ATP synthase protein MI25 n=1 Tax=Blepharisma stoltei TaxID=1481888 RepID=A0AAU9JNW8_9CILI|nr:unnamed protein product [Blepharisma stoltei]
MDRTYKYQLEFTKTTLLLVLLGSFSAQAFCIYFYGKVLELDLSEFWGYFLAFSLSISEILLYYAMIFNAKRYYNRSAIAVEAQLGDCKNNKSEIQKKLEALSLIEEEATWRSIGSCNLFFIITFIAFTFAIGNVQLNLAYVYSAIGASITTLALSLFL